METFQVGQVGEREASKQEMDFVETAIFGKKMRIFQIYNAAFRYNYTVLHSQRLLTVTSLSLLSYGPKTAAISPMILPNNLPIGQVVLGRLNK